MYRNLHAPQSITTANELIELAAVPNLIISVRECKPIVAIVQDVALGVFRFTKSGVTLTEKQMFNLLANNLKFTGDVPKPMYNKGGVMKWSGRQALSTIIPKNINVKGPNKSYEPTDTNKDLENFVIIENGELLQGIVDKTIYQNRTKGLIHSIYNECSPHETRIFFDNTQKMMCDWLVLSGFSVGISDLVVDDDTNIKLKEMIHEMKVNVYDVIRDIHMGTFENKSINNNNIFFEEEVNKILNQTISKVGKVALSNLNDLYNRMINMVKAGSKGSIINVSQMIACLGQQNVDGKRIPYGFEDRTLPHYTKYDDGPESRGFVENSFMTGLTPQQFFFHSMGGREGLIDTAVKSVTGDTPIIIIEDGKSKYVKIGDWIDSQLDIVQKDRIKYFPEDRNMEFLNLDKQVYIPTCNEDGNVSWGELTAITRHDPGERLYEVKTQGGRCVIVAESKSLLIWNEKVKEFQAINSPDVKIGDSMPVTAKLAQPPVIIDIVDMVEYFPKKEYIHGTEFNKAIHIMEKAMFGRIQVPRGWWKSNNGDTFTLPYTKKSSLTRVTSGRSNTENIKNGCIYPYHATIEHCLLPDKFELTKENGIFIGLFLAEGSSCDKSGTVTITNIDPKVQGFVKGWFDKFSIKNELNTRINKIGGISSSVIGNSSLLARFLDKFVGHGAHHKYIPDVAFVAPDEFIVGILNGYFTGDGTIGKTNIDAGSASSRLTEGISMLCTRLGIFGKVFITQLKSNNVGTIDIAPSHRISIRGQWAQIFANKVELLIESKQQQLECMKPSDIHRNFKEYNNIVFDEIKEINILAVDKYPKLYDVTVPSTLNFQIANGLNVRDTSETGYLQRKLVKAMEDCKINYDYTVRNASGSIVQFLYGEDGIDATKIEAQPILYIDMDYAKLKKEYHLIKNDNCDFLLSDDTIKEFNDSKDWEDRMNKHFEQILKDREFIIKDVFDSIKETSIMYPVSFMRIINNTKALYNKYEKEVLSDLSPIYVLDTINKLSDELYINKNNRGNKFIGILLRCYFSPKKVLYDYKFSKMAFDNIIQQIRLKFYDAIAHPSEMVGVIAAQSIGEP